MDKVQFKRPELEDQEIIQLILRNHQAEAVNVLLQMFIFGPDTIK